MKTIKEIQEEYQKYKGKTDFINNLEEFASFMLVGLDDIEEARSEINKEKQENKKWELSAKIRNFFYFLFEEEDVSFYKQDNAILDESIQLTIKQEEYFQKIIEIASEENIQELVKLTDFCCEYYNQHIDYLESKRDALEYAYKGYNFYNGRLEDNRESFNRFFEQKMKELSPQKSVEKTKKI